MLNILPEFQWDFCCTHPNLSPGDSAKGGVDGVGPANMSGDLPSKKYQLKLRPLGVGVPTVGHMVSP